MKFLKRFYDEDLLANKIFAVASMAGAYFSFRIDEGIGVILCVGFMLMGLFSKENLIR